MSTSKLTALESPSPDFRLRRLAEEIAHFTPDLAEVLCRNAISTGFPESAARLEWLKHGPDDPEALVS